MKKSLIGILLSLCLLLCSCSSGGPYTVIYLYGKRNVKYIAFLLYGKGYSSGDGSCTVTSD